MKRVEIFQGEMHNYGADNGDSVFLGTSLRIMSLSDKGGTYNAPGYGFNLTMGSSAILVIFGMLSFILFIAFLVLILCRRTTIVERTTTFRRQVTNDNGRGLERAVIESFPVFSYGLVRGLKSHEAKGSECTVCLSDFADEEMVRLLPKCSHAFHPECIDTWLCSHTTCPVCRTSLVPGEDSGVPTATAEPRTTPEQVVIVVDNGNNEAPAETSNDSRRYSLVRVRREMEQGTEWCISTAAGLKPGLRKSFSFSGHRLFQKPRNLNFAASEAKPGGSVADAGQGSRSEGSGAGSMNKASFIRSFSER